MSVFDIRRRLRNLIVHSYWGHKVLRTVRPSEVFLSVDTQLMIEGYPRSGNSYAEAAFLISQGNSKVRLAHHSHAAGHVLASVREGLPILIIYRDPIDAAASFIEECRGKLTAATALREYVQFYKPLLPISNKYILASFDTLTTDLHLVIAMLNLRFGTDFETGFRETKENVEAVWEKVDEISLRRSNFITRYSNSKTEEEQQNRKSNLKEFRSLLLNHESFRNLRKDAYKIYDELRRIDMSQQRCDFREPNG